MRQKESARKAHPKVSIIIVNYNNPEDTIECLRSIHKISYPNYDVILVDNASSDDSIERIRRYLERDIRTDSDHLESDQTRRKTIYTKHEQAHLCIYRDWFERKDPSSSNRSLVLIRNDKNIGFAEGNNTAIRYALKALSPDYFLLLNNDAFIIENDFLNELVRLADSDSKIGMVGPKILYYHEPEKVWAAGGIIRFFSGDIRNLGQDSASSRYSGIMRADYVPGCVLLIKKKVFEEVGLFDNDYFLFFEDADLGLRSCEHGFTSVVDLDVSVLHKAAATMKKVGFLNYYHFTRSKLIFMKKHARWYHFPSFICFFITNFAGMFVYNLMKGQRGKSAKLAWGLRDFTTGKSDVKTPLGNKLNQ